MMNKVFACIAIDKTLTGVIRIKHWNHIINSVKLWLRRYGAKSTEIPVCVKFTRVISSANIPRLSD